MKKTLWFSVAILCASRLPAVAIDHGNLDENRPLRVEDAYSIATGEIAVEVGAGFAAQRRATDQAFFPVEILYGAYRGLQLSMGSTFWTDPREVDDPHHSGDLHLSALYNFNQETLSWPAFGLKGSVNLPTGVRSEGADFQIKGLMTKSFHRLSLHFNPAYEFLRNGPQERSGRYSLIVGASYPPGAPRYTRTTLLGDIFTEQSHQRGESNTYGAEIGLRHQLTQRSIVDLGLGSEFAGPSQRSLFFIQAGLSLGF